MPMMMSACSGTRGARGIVLALLLATCATGTRSSKVTGRLWWDDEFGDGIELECQSNGEELSRAGYLEEVDIPPFDRTELERMYAWADSDLPLPIGNLLVAYCPAPRGSLADVLAALQYPVGEPEQLTLWQVNPAHTPRAENFADLPLKKIDFSFGYMQSDDKPHLNPDVFSSLDDLSELNISGTTLSPMPSTSRLTTVKLHKGRSTGAWGGCAELRELTLDSWTVPATVGDEEDEGWLAHCPQLNTMRAHWMSASSLVRALRGARALTSLQLWSKPQLSQMQLDSIFSGMPLQQLEFPYEMFILMSENTLSTSLEKLTLYGADWSSDEEEQKRLVRRLTRLPALRDLTLGYHSPDADFCKLFPENGSLPALRRLTLKHMTMEKLCFSGWESLEYLDLTYNKIRELELVQLPPARAHPLLVDLRHATVQDITLDEVGYNLLRDRFSEMANVTILGKINMDCDCEHAWVARALRTLPLSISRVYCQDVFKDYGGALLSDVPAELLECSRSECGQCACRRAWRDNATAATCGSAATRAPRALGLRALHAAGSRIDALHTDDLPDTLLILNLTDSRISRLDEAAVGALFSVSARLMWLAGNPLACDCAARPLLAALQRQRAQVQDFKRMTCVDGRALHALDVDALCYPPENPSTHQLHNPKQRHEILLTI